MFNTINLQNNTMFYSSNSNYLTANKCTHFSVGGVINSLFYKDLYHNFNINNKTISSSFRYNYL